MNHYQLVCEAYDLVHESYYTPVVLTTGIGLAGLGFRFKRQADDYKKIKTKFPTPQKMLDFLNSKGIQDTKLSLIANSNDPVSYDKWLRKNIIKQGRILRIIGQYGFLGPVTTAYNTAKYYKHRDMDADELVTDAY